MHRAVPTLAGLRGRFDGMPRGTTLDDKEHFRVRFYVSFFGGG